MGTNPLPNVASNTSNVVVYVGTRVPGQVGGCEVVAVLRSGKRHRLPPRQDVHNHSPDGFQWGYGGSGPAQLALALCCHAVGIERARRVYQQFKFRFVARIQTDVWTFSRADIITAIESIEQEHGR